MEHLDITFEVAENPSRDIITRHREDGGIELVFQMTKKQMDEIMIRNLKKRAK